MKVSVIASFDTKGNVIPIYFRYEEYQIKVQVEKIWEEGPTLTRCCYFECSYIQNGYNRRVVLKYNYIHHDWELILSSN